VAVPVPSPPAEVDVVVIGGGVNGTGVARDLALRGLRIALFERNDLAFGASGNSSGMIHGGPRYLPSNPWVTKSSCMDSGFIQRIAPHLLFRIPFIMPVDRRLGARVYLTLVDAAFGAYDKFQPLKRGKKHARLNGHDTRRIEPAIRADLVGAITFDEWGIDGSRLCVANALDAFEHDGSIHVHTTVERIERNESGRACGVIWRDRLTGCTGTTHGSMVVNATGAWGPITASLSGLSPKKALVRPGKGIHIVFDRRLSNHAVAVQTIDDRQVFAMPWQNVTVLGTTDTDYYGDLDDVRATSDDVRYLIQAMARIMPSIREARIIGTYAGVRPTLYAYGPIPDALSREHHVIDHAHQGADGLYSMIGGKLASYRQFAEEAADLVALRLGRDTRCTTHERPLPGGDKTIGPDAFARDHGIDPVAARRVIYRHGSRALQIGELMLERPQRKAMVCVCESISDAEIRFVVRNEFARSVCDVSRRTRLGLGPCGAMRCALRCSAIVAEELGMEPAEGVEQARSFLMRMARARVVGMGPAQARQEALAIASIRSQCGLTGGRA
jgi:glycerol-3-phosphate dehydrogenase